MNEENYPSIGSDARRRGAPWFKLFSTELLAKTRHLSMFDVGVYATLLAAMHEAGRPIDDDNRRLGRLCRCKTTAIAKAKETLLTDGFIVRTRHGLWSQAMQEQIENERIKSKLARQNVSQRWEKDKQNQIAGDTAVRKEDIDIDASGGGPPAPPPSAVQRRSSSKNYTSDMAHREGFESPPRVGQEIADPEFGECIVEQVQEQAVCVRSLETGRRHILDYAPAVDVDDDCPF